MTTLSSFTNIINAEINILVYLLKQHKNWTALANTNNIKLLKDFYILKLKLKNQTDMEDLCLLDVLRPFLQIMMSDCTDGASTSAAITSLTKFITYNFIKQECEKRNEIVTEIWIAIQNTRFIGSDSSSDEIVLMKNVNLIKTLIMSSIGIYMTNYAVCQSIQSCFRICFQSRLSELLRNICVSALNEIIHHIFSRLSEFVNLSDNIVSYLDHEALKIKITSRMPVVNYKKKRKDEHKIVSNNAVIEEHPKKHSLKKNNSKKLEKKKSSNYSTQSDTSTDDTHKNNSKLSDNHLSLLENSIKSAPPSINSLNTIIEPLTTTTLNGQSDNSQSDNDISTHTNKIITNFSDEKIPLESDSISLEKNVVKMDEEDVMNSPYNLVCLYEFLQYISLLIDPFDRKDNYIQIIKINIELLHVAVESSLEHLKKYPLLMNILKDKIFFNLFQILKLNIGELLSCTLNVCFMILISLRQYLPCQFESFLILLANISSSTKHSFEKRELFLDCLSQVLTTPLIASELFANFDCNQYHHDVVQILVSRLKYIIENSTKSSILREFATDNMLLIVESLVYEVLQHEKYGIQQDDDLTKRKLDFINEKCKKNKIISCCEEFNNNPNNGISLLEQFNCIEKKDSPDFNKSLGQFLYRFSDRLDKKVLGEFLGKRKSGKILAEFLLNCDFKNMNIEQALRAMLQYFRLPGESPVISLILDQFAAYFLKLNPNDVFENHDAVFTLAYAIIMLNVDQHNENARQTLSMNCEQFIRNVKGINNGKDFPTKMLYDIFHSIHENEIVLPEEQDGYIKEKYMWNRSLERLLYYNNDSSSCHHCYYLYSTRDLTVDNIKISFAFEIFQILWPSICDCLSLSIIETPEKSRLIALINAYSKCIRLASKAGMIDIVDSMMTKLIGFSNILNPDLTIEDVIMHVGLNTTTRLTCQVAFRNVNINGDFLRDSWLVVFRAILILFKCKLLPDDMLQVFDFLSDTRRSYIIQPHSFSNCKNDSYLSSDVLDNTSNNNFFSSIYQMLLTSNDAIKSQNLDAAYEQAYKLIKDCNLEKFIPSDHFLQPESLIQKLRAIIELYYSISDNDSKSKVFLLEIISRVVIANCHRFSIFWCIIKNFYYRIVSSCTINSKKYLVERIVVSILRIIIIVSQKLYKTSSDDINNCVKHFSCLLRSIVLIDSNLILSMSNHISFGIFEHIASNCDHIRSSKDWVILLKLLEIVGAGNVILNKAAIFSVPVVIPSSDNSKGSSSFIWTEHDVFNETNCDDIWLIMKSMWELYLSPTSDETDLKELDHTTCKDGEKTSLYLLPFSHHIHYIPKHLQSFLKSIETLNFLTKKLHITPTNPTNTTNLDCLLPESVTFSNINYLNFVPICHCLLIFAQVSHNIHMELLAISSSNSNGKDQKKLSDTVKKCTNNKPLLTTKNMTDNSHHTVRKSIDEATIDLFDCISSLLECFMDNNPSSYFYCGENIHQKLVYCLPFMKMFAFYCVDQRESVRNYAFDRLYSLFLGGYFKLASLSLWEQCFNNILCPLLGSLLESSDNENKNCKQSPSRIDNINTLRLKIVSMVGKIFLQNISILHSSSNFEMLWFNLLQLIIDHLNVSQNDEIILEAVPEMIKNILFVMFTLGVFDIDCKVTSDCVDYNHPTTSDSNDTLNKKLIFFNETYNLVKRYLPSLKENLLSLSNQTTKFSPSSCSNDVTLNNDNNGSTNKDMPQLK